MKCGKESGQKKTEVEKEKGEMRSAPSGVAVIHLAQPCQENLAFLFEKIAALIRRKPLQPIKIIHMQSGFLF